MGSRVRTAIARGSRAALACVLALALLAAAQAGAKTFFSEMGGRVVRWDERVTTSIAGCEKSTYCRAAVEGTRVYLRRGASRPGPGSVRGLRRVGIVDGAGILRFRVPRVGRGRYHLVAAVRLTAGGTRPGRASGTFRIRAR